MIPERSLPAQQVGRNAKDVQVCWESSSRSPRMPQPSKLHLTHFRGSLFLLFKTVLFVVSSFLLHQD